MRIWLSGPRIFGIRPGISLGRGDFRARRSTERSGSGGFVYVVARDGDRRVKIGCSVNPPSRLASLQTGSADPLHIAYSMQVPARMVEIEQRAHQMLDRHRGLGEWFDVPVEAAVAAISAAAYSHRTALAGDCNVVRNRWLLAASVAASPCLIFLFIHQPEIAVGSGVGGLIMFPVLRKIWL